MASRYDEVMRSVGGREGIRAEWEALSEAERDEFVEAHGGRAGKAFDAYLSKRAAQEIEFRDAEWFKTGVEPEVDWSLNPESNYGVLKPGKSELPLTERFAFENFVNEKGRDGVHPGTEWRDLFAIHALKAAGFPVATGPKDALDANGKVIDGATNPDIRIGSRMWEIKSPVGSQEGPKPGRELKFVEEQMKKTVHNFRHPYSEKTMRPIEDYSGGMRPVLNLGYHGLYGRGKDEVISEVAAKMKRYGIGEVVIVWKDASLTKLSK